MFLSDSLTNLVSGMGTDKDKVTQASFAYRFLGKPELDAMYTSDWLAGTVVDAPCDDMTREWRSWKAGTRQVGAIQGEERRLRIRQRVNLALKQARQYGGSLILIGTGDPHPEEELVTAKIAKGGVTYLHVLSRFEVSTGPLDRDPLSATFGEPSYYTLNSTVGSDVQIHPSRVVRFLGQAPLELTYTTDGWGLSVLQRVYDAIRNVAATSGNLASLTYEAKLDVISVPNLTQNALDPFYQQKIIQRFALANRSKSINNALLLDAAEKWEQKKISLGEFPTVLRLFLEIAAGAANMPVTRLIGTSAKGLNATGDGDLRHYYDTLSSRQEVELRPALERLDDVLVRSALGTHPANVDYEFNALWQLTDAEKAAVGLQKAQTTQIYGQLGIMDPEALRQAARGQLVADGLYPGLEGILEQNQGQAAPLVAAGASPVDPGHVTPNIASNSGGLKE